MEFAIEDIPDDDHLYMRIHSKTILEGEPYHGVFKNHGTGMSTNWSKYSDANKTQEQGPKAAENYGVLSMQVGDVRLIPQQVVVHTPEPDNRAHTDVEGMKDSEVRFKLFDCASFAILPD